VQWLRNICGYEQKERLKDQKYQNSIAQI